MATITTDTFLDNGTTRSTNEVWSINGATLTIRTDTRWYDGAPASMTGTLGSIILSSADGGNFTVDGTAVRELQFTSGSGVAPAIGTIITQGAASGYLLGVYGDLTAAPTAVGAAVPNSGYLKFREVTGGFVSGALTGIACTASGPDVVSWIEVVLSSIASVNIQDANVCQFNGEWYYLGLTNGAPGQIFQVPTNGGGANTHVPGVQVETAPGSDVYYWVPCTTVAVSWTTANMEASDRARACQSVGNGQVRFGSDGTTNMGFLPPSGCRVRIGNIFLRRATTTAQATNLAPGTALSVVTAIGGFVNFSKVVSDWFFSTNSPCSLSIQDSASNVITTQRGSVEIIDSLFCPVGYSYAQGPLQFTGLTNTTFSNVVVAGQASGTNNGQVVMNNCSNLVWNNCEFVAVKKRTVSNANTVFMNLCTGITFNNSVLNGGTLFAQLSNGIRVNDTDYSDGMLPTASAVGTSVFAFQNCGDVVVDGLTLGRNGLYTEAQPYNFLFRTTVSTGLIKFRNAGTATSPLDTGTTFATQALAQLAGINESSIQLQRLYVTRTRATGWDGIVSNRAKDSLFEHLYIGNPTSGTWGANSLSGATMRLNSGIATSLGVAYATTWATLVSSSTAGQLLLFTSMQDSRTDGQYTTSFDPKPGTSFSSQGLSMDTVGDFVIMETPWSIKGYTQFTNSTMNVSGFSTGSMYSYEYQLDTGAGYSGTWAVMSGANLSAESISPAGFKMKVKITCTVRLNTSQTIQGLMIPMTTTATALEQNLYDLDSVTLSFEGLQPGSEVRAYVGTDPATAVEIGGIESVSGTTWSFTHSSAGVDGYIAVFALGFNPLIIPRTYASSDSTLLISQVVDRTYVNP